MKLGVIMFVTPYSIGIVQLAKLAEQLGFESLFVPEHPAVPANPATPFPQGGPIPRHYKETIDPFVGLSAAAAATTKLRLGTGICLVPQRNPIFTAKEITTLDLVSGGRFEFGIGAGWLKEEVELFGGDFAHRWTQVKDHIQAMKACWGPDPSEHHGKYANFGPIHLFPKPVQQPHPPILIAGESDKALGRVAAYGDGWIPRGRTFAPKDLEAGRKKIEAQWKANGRKGRFTVTIFAAPPNRQSNRDLFNAGADRILHMAPSEDEAKTKSLVEKWKGEVM
ncbi:MAG: LLM class F420-dependent oxidoreductase [SAR324 cluster bacterium]